MTDEGPGPLAPLLPVYRVICVVCGVVGLLAAAFFFASSDALMGWIFVVLTALLWPAYRAFAHAVRRRQG